MDNLTPTLDYLLTNKLAHFYAAGGNLDFYIRSFLCGRNNCKVNIIVGIITLNASK